MTVGDLLTIAPGTGRVSADLAVDRHELGRRVPGRRSNGPAGGAPLQQREVARAVAVVQRATGQSVKEYMRPGCSSRSGSPGTLGHRNRRATAPADNGLACALDFLKWGDAEPVETDGGREGGADGGLGGTGGPRPRACRVTRPGAWDGRGCPVEPGGAADRPGLRLQVGLGPGESYYASGNVRRTAWCSPRPDAVIALTAAIPAAGHQELSELVSQRLVPAFRTAPAHRARRPGASRRAGRHGRTRRPGPRRPAARGRHRRGVGRTTAAIRTREVASPRPALRTGGDTEDSHSTN